LAHLSKNWFTVHPLNEHIIGIQERLDLIEPRFLTKYVNMFLINGTEKSILFDTGSGLNEIRSILSPLIKQEELIVINSHSHFDHVGSNAEFPSIYIHHNDLDDIVNGLDIGYLKTSKQKIATGYEKSNYMLLPSRKYNTLFGGEEFDLGEIIVKVLHTPGHTPGSICLKTSTGDLLSGDTAHYGPLYLPRSNELNQYKESLELLSKMCDEGDITYFYPGHEEIRTTTSLIEELISKLSEIIDDNHQTWFYDEYLNAEINENEPFTFIRPV
jgi:glyoxylase-like metal-dependent hydrolase (beta-lactamase superfamily II)